MEPHPTNDLPGRSAAENCVTYTDYNLLRRQARARATMEPYILAYVKLMSDITACEFKGYHVYPNGTFGTIYTEKATRMIAQCKRDLASICHSILKDHGFPETRFEIEETT